MPVKGQPGPRLLLGRLPIASRETGSEPSFTETHSTLRLYTQYSARVGGWEKLGASKLAENDEFVYDQVINCHIRILVTVGVLVAEHF